MGDPPARGSEPLGLHVWPQPLPDALRDLRGLRVEFSSRGDRPAARLLLPAGAGPFPLILLQHGAGGSKDADYLDATAGPWVRGGAAVLSVDLPLHGERRSAKLSERLLEGLARREVRDAATATLWRGFVEQAVADLGRALDAAATRPELDPARTAYAAFSLGSIVGAAFLARDPRPRAAALALGGGGLGPPESDPIRHIGRFAPRPLLFVNATRDRTVPRAAAEALHAAAGEPKRVAWFDAGHTGLPGRALKAMWTFLRGELGL